MSQRLLIAVYASVLICPTGAARESRGPLVVNARPVSHHYCLEDRVIVEVELLNRGHSPVRVDPNGLARGGTVRRIPDIGETDVTPWELSWSASGEPRVQSGLAVLKPGDRISREIDLMDLVLNPLRPGRYILQFAYSHYAKEDNAAGVTYEGPVLSDSVVFEVGPCPE